jgi:hypothetical protein
MQLYQFLGLKLLGRNERSGSLDTQQRRGIRYVQYDAGWLVAGNWDKIQLLIMPTECRRLKLKCNREGGPSRPLPIPPGGEHTSPCFGAVVTNFGPCSAV